MYYTVYKTTNLKNNKIYVGVHQTENINDEYLGSGKALKLAIKKYGKVNFRKDILYIFDNSSEMFEKEKEIVNEKFVEDRNTYNTALGGIGGASYVNKGKSLSEEHKEKLKKAKENYKPWNVGKRNVQNYSNERNLKISESRKNSRGKMMFIYFEYNDGSIKRTKIYKELFEEYFQQGWRYGAKRKIK